MKKYPFTIAWTFIIISLSLMYVPHVELVDLPFHLGWDKIVHGLIYSALMVILLLEIHRTHADVRAKYYGIAALYSLMLGGAMELCQAFFTTWRSGRWDDMCANTIGTILGLIVAILVRKVAKN